MGNKGFRDDLRQALDKHSSDMSADDLRDVASRLEQVASRWETNEEIL